MKGLTHLIDCWIRRFYEKNENDRKLIEEIHQHLQTVQSLGDLEQLLRDYYKPIETETDTDNRLQCKIKEWLALCSEIQQLFKKALYNLDKIEDETGLKEFCLQVLNKKNAPLHYNVRSILTPLSDLNGLKNLMVFLGKLPESEDPISRNPATFEAQEPTDDLHKAAIQLLRNNAYHLKQISHAHQDFKIVNTANGLLQALLKLHMEHEDKLDSIEALPQIETKPGTGCILS